MIDDKSILEALTSSDKKQGLLALRAALLERVASIENLLRQFTDWTGEDEEEEFDLYKHIASLPPAFRFINFPTIADAIDHLLATEGDGKSEAEICRVLEEGGIGINRADKAGVTTSILKSIEGATSKKDNKNPRFRFDGNLLYRNPDYVPPLPSPSRAKRRRKPPSA